jgi:hypothetical protein
VNVVVDLAVIELSVTLRMSPVRGNNSISILS